MRFGVLHPHSPDTAMWNNDTATAFDAWFASHEGAFALDAMQQLFQRLISGWPRRGHSLLDVGCGSGVFLEMLRDYGFDVTGLDPCPDNLAASKVRLGGRAELRLGVLDHLPFDDNSVDYVSLLSPLAHAEQPVKVLSEAFRVARMGVLIGFMNTWSIQGLIRRHPFQRRQRTTASDLYRGFNPWQMYRLIRCLCPHARLHIRSTLPGPAATWRNSSLWGRLNNWVLPLPLGAYTGLCADVQNDTPLTPIHLLSRERPLCLSPLAY